MRLAAVLARLGFYRLEADADRFEDSRFDQRADFIDARRRALGRERQMTAQSFVVNTQALPRSHDEIRIVIK